MPTAQEWIKNLNLRPHPEGGYFRETYRSHETIAHSHLPGRFAGDRTFSTAIYFLLQGDDFSALHRLKSDEVWHFYDGTSLTITVIAPDGELSVIHLGTDVHAGHVPQAVVRAGCLFGSHVSEPNSYALVGCTVAPGFDFADFELPSREQLMAEYPQHRGVIERLTRVTTG
jgi:predicted cupin superfamily sugar epimerase